LAATSRAIVTYRIGKRDGTTTDDFVQHLRMRVLGSPEISTDGYHPYRLSIRDAFRQQRSRRHHQDGISSRSSPEFGARLLTGRSSSGRARRHPRRAGGNLHIARRAIERRRSHGITSLHAADEWPLEEA